MEVLVLFGLFHDDHFSVGRSHDDAVRIALEGADGTLEEVQQDAIENGAYRDTDVEGQPRLEDVQYGKVEHQQHDGAPEESRFAFVMKSYFLEFS